MLFLIRWFLLSCIRLLVTPGQSVGCWNTRWNDPLWTSNPIFVCSKILFKSNWFTFRSHIALAIVHLCFAIKCSWTHWKVWNESWRMATTIQPADQIHASLLAARISDWRQHQHTHLNYSRMSVPEWTRHHSEHVASWFDFIFAVEV